MKISLSQKNSLIRIQEITFGLNEEEGVLKNRIVEILGINEDEIISYSIVKRAVDSRNKRRILFVYSVDVKVKDPESCFSALEQSTESSDKIKRYKILLQEPYIYEIKNISSEVLEKRPVVVGTGPCGLFAALLLAKSGLKPLVIERGRDVDSRIKDVDRFFQKRELNINSNVQFGEGGAGAFSDGKLNTLISNPRIKYIFEELIKAGAPKEIAWDAKPHIGTDKLRQVVKNIRKKIIELGGEVRFDTCLTNIEVDEDSQNKKIVAAVFNNTEKVLTDNLVIATGHSARDTYEMLLARQMKIIAKPFSVGLRIEHEAEMINRFQYGGFYNHPKLPTARYKLVGHLQDDRSVYTFCMCPGGYVVAASSEEGMVVTNGMSEYSQNGKNSNSALLVNVSPSDFGSDHPLAGIEFQRTLEKKAFISGGSNYNAPAQLVGDFLKNRASTNIKSVTPTYKPGVTLTSLDNCLPDYVVNSIRKGLIILDRKIKGFAHPDALLTGVETRSSSPVRLLRDESYQSNIRGVYPAGEGAGYAGGIISSAVDGLMVAEAVIGKYIK